MAERSVMVRLLADTKQYTTSMAGAAKGMDTLEAKMESSQKKAERWKRVGQVSRVAGAAMAAGLALATKAASDQEQALGGLDAVFKDSAESMRKNAEAAVELGLSQTEYAESATRIGAMLSNMGMSQDQVAESTQELVVRAADLSAALGGTTAEAVNALGAALRGEADPAERFGLDLKITAVNAEMAATGLSKAEAVMSLIKKQMESSGTTGQLSREYDSTAASAQRMAAEWKNASAALGEALLPAMTAGANAARSVAEIFNNLPDPIKKSATVFGVLAAVALLLGPRIITLGQGLVALKAKMLASGVAATATGQKFMTMGNAAKKAGGPITLLITALGAMAIHSGNVQASGEEIADTFDEVGNATDATRQKLAELMLFNFDQSHWSEVGLNVGEAVAALTTGGEAWDRYYEKVVQMRDAAPMGSTERARFGALLSTLEAAERDYNAAGTAAENNAEANDAAADSAERGALAHDESARGRARDANAARDQKAANDALKESLEDYIRIQLAMSGSQDALIGAEKRLAEARNANGQSLVGKNEAAAANRETLRDELGLILAVADAAKAEKEAMDDSAGATEAYEETVNRLVPKLVAQAEAAGMNRAEVVDYISSLTGIPKKTLTKVIVEGAKGGKRDVDNLRNGVNRLPKSKNVKVGTPGATDAKGETDDLDTSLDDLPDVTYVKVNDDGTVSTVTGRLQNLRSAALSADGEYFMRLTYYEEYGGRSTSRASGGIVRGPGTSTSDSIRARLSDGEFVVRARSVDKYGVGLLDAINRGVYDEGEEEEEEEGFRRGGRARRRGRRARAPRRTTTRYQRKKKPKKNKNKNKNKNKGRNNAPAAAPDPPLSEEAQKREAAKKRAKRAEKRRNSKKAQKQRGMAEWGQGVIDKFTEKFGGKDGYLSKKELKKMKKKLSKKQWQKFQKARKEVRKWKRMDAAIEEGISDKEFEAQEKERERAEKEREILDDLDGLADRWEDHVKAKKDYAAQMAKATKDTANALSAFDFARSTSDVNARRDAEERLADAIERTNRAENPQARADALRDQAQAQKDLTKAKEQEAKSAHTVSNYMKAYSDKLSQARTFQSQMATLQARGLSMGFLEEIAQAGPERAADMLKVFTQMSGTQLRTLNAQRAQIEAAGQAVGNGLANTTFAAAEQALKVEIAAAPVNIKLDTAEIAAALIEFKRRTGTNI